MKEKYLDYKERGEVKIESKVHYEPLHLILIFLAIFFSHRVTLSLVPKQSTDPAVMHRTLHTCHQLIIQPRPSTPLLDLRPTHRTRHQAHKPTTTSQNLVRKRHPRPNPTRLPHINVRMQRLTGLLPLQLRTQPPNPWAWPALRRHFPVPFPPDNTTSSSHVALSRQHKNVSRNFP